MLNVTRIQESFYCMRYKNGLRESTMIFLVALTERAVAVMSPRQGGISPCYRVQ